MLSRVPGSVVGAGIGGLVMAHALHRADIDYVVVEKYAQVGLPTGSVASIWPGSQRILHQLGLLEKIQGVPDRALATDSDGLHRKTKYTADNADEAAAGFAGLPMDEAIVFGDLWKTKIRGGMGNVEGCHERWHHGRIVLVGDAVHCVTPLIGVGGNMCIESVAVLANALKEAVVANAEKGGGESRLSLLELETALERHQERRLARALNTWALDELRVAVPVALAVTHAACFPIPN
ncbi:hypothetical protein L249_5190 [Ophiocordyceps polyrhachis-furcata BCC 54312]|uniref:FAD-binding domain-containing protein n=1 Tax=Ophiocordyceps polyrhachis-furcata BCC 54312 TaxID=1330021 RepID=A0A367L8V8_9HYPO|nr:hypothetical protein L249_5190 [Ophiocordyceps polyrhachis-furcata BCC 54312]